jgi:hypothetical protein
MPTVRIGNVPDVCNHPDHSPAWGVVFPPGKYQHTCPRCGMVTYFTISRVYCSATQPSLGSACEIPANVRYD